MDDISKSIRELVLQTLTLIATKEEQEKYQQRMPAIDVPAELFDQGGDCYFPEDFRFQAGFTSEELEALVQFHEVFEVVSDSMPRELPSLEEFLETSAWDRLSAAARSTLRFLDTQS